MANEITSSLRIKFSVAGEPVKELEMLEKMQDAIGVGAQTNFYFRSFTTTAALIDGSHYTSGGKAKVVIGNLDDTHSLFVQNGSGGTPFTHVSPGQFVVLENPDSTTVEYYVRADPATAPSSVRGVVWSAETG